MKRDMELLCNAIIVESTDTLRTNVTFLHNVFIAQDHTTGMIVNTRVQDQCIGVLGAKDDTARFMSFVRKERKLKSG